MRKIIIIISIVLIVFYFAYSFLLYKKPSDENTITFASWGSQSEVSILNELIEEFVSKNKINVDFLHIPQNYFQKIHLLFASNTPPVSFCATIRKSFIVQSESGNGTPFFRNKSLL